MARASRRRLFEMAARENIPIAAAHIAFPGVGRVRTAGDGFAFDPTPWQLF